MSENCNDCRPSIQIENLLVEVNEIKAKVGVLEVEISTVKQSAAINQEQTKMVFNILKEIKESIFKISDKMDEVEGRPNKLLQNVAGGVTVAVIMLAINLWLKYKGGN